MDELQTLNEQTMQPPKSRLGAAGNAYGFVCQLTDNDQLRADRRTKVQGNIDGNPPFNKTELEARGMGDRTNLNFRQGAAILNQFRISYFDLAEEVPLIADIKTAFGTATERGEWSQVISEEFHRMLKQWKPWNFIVQFSQNEMLTHGIGPVYFPDNTDWRPDVARIGDVLVRDRARARVSELDAIAILKGYTQTEIYKYIVHEQKARELGWNITEVERAIIDSHFGTQEPNFTSQQREWYQQEFKNADIFSGDDAQEVKTAHLMTQEFTDESDSDGKISHQIIRTDRRANDYLYRRMKRFDSMEDVIVPFFYDIGNGTWHSIGGIGKEIYAYCHVFNRLRCREVDGAMIASSILLQQKDASNITKSQLLSINNLSILPAGLQVTPTNIGQGIEATTSVRRDMEASLGQNIGSLYKSPNSPNPRKGQKQAIMEMQQQAQVAKGRISLWYVQYDTLLEKIFGRVVSPLLRAGMPGGREALEFRRRCEMRGVPKEALRDIDYVRAYRSVGAGSAANRIGINEWLMENAGSFPEEGKIVAVKMAIASMAGNQVMHAIMGDGDGAQKNNDSWEATMENGTLRAGTMTDDQLRDLITKEQSNVRHLEIHLSDAEKHTQEVQEQATQQGMQMSALQGLFIHLHAAGVHCFFHLDAIKNDPIRVNDYKALFKRWQQLSREQDQVKQQLEEMQQQQQDSTQPSGDPSELLKMLTYKDAPESVKAHLEAIAGVPRQEGDLSVPGHNTQIKEVNTQLKAKRQEQQYEKQRQNMAIDDVDTSLKVAQHQQDKMTPAP